MPQSLTSAIAVLSKGTDLGLPIAAWDPGDFGAEPGEDSVWGVE